MKPSRRARQIPLGNRYTQLVAIDRARQRVSQSADISKIYSLLPTTLPCATANLGARWKDLMTDIGGGLLPSAVGGSNLLSVGLKDFDGIIRRYPIALNAVTYGLVGLSAAATLGGVGILNATSCNSLA
jgi:hypothetical protein